MFDVGIFTPLALTLPVKFFRFINGFNSNSSMLYLHRLYSHMLPSDYALPAHCDLLSLVSVVLVVACDPLASSQSRQYGL
jgi:hypothetical protein